MTQILIQCPWVSIHPLASLLSRVFSPQRYPSLRLDLFASFDSLVGRNQAAPSRYPARTRDRNRNQGQSSSSVQHLEQATSGKLNPNLNHQPRNLTSPSNPTSRRPSPKSPGTARPEQHHAVEPDPQSRQPAPPACVVAVLVATVCVAVIVVFAVSVVRIPKSTHHTSHDCENDKNEKTQEAMHAAV